MIAAFREHTPELGPGAWAAPSASVIGRVFLGSDASIWYGSVLRGDINEIHVGERSNIQDNSVLHVADDLPCLVGNDVVVGHNVNLHGCVVANRVLVGIGAIILNGAKIGEECIIGAGALVTEGTEIPPGSLVLGSPAKVRRELTDDERASITHFSHKYVRVKQEHQRDIKVIG